MRGLGLSETLLALRGQLRRAAATGAFADAVERAAALDMRAPVPAGVRATLLAGSTALLRAEAAQVVDELVYAWTRLLVAQLDGDATVPYLGHVAISERDAVIARFHPRPQAASVAVPVTADPDAGETILISRRSSINGHTGLPMDNADEVVLFGGAAEPGEPAPLVALRELGEEAGVPRAADLSDLRYDPYLELGGWSTEGGFRARGFLVRVPADIWSEMRFDEREVAAVGRLTLDALFLAELRVRSHLVVGLGQDRAPLFVGWFDSPTCAVSDADDGDVWELSGLAGQMVANLRRRYRSPDGLRDALDRRRRHRARATTGRAAAPDMIVRAHRARRLMDTMLAIGRPPVLRAPALSALLGEPALLVVDAALPLGGSSKARSLAGTLQGALEARAERDGHSGQTPAQLFDGATLIAASTGSHARAVAALAGWIERTVGDRPACEFFVSADITAGKLAALRAAGAVTLCQDFNDATDAGRAREYELSCAGERAVFLACDPEERLNAAFGVSGMDGAAGFATLLLDVLAELRDRWAALGLDRPHLSELRVPTSGGATWAACTALHRDLIRDANGTATSGATLDTVAAVYDVAAPCLPRALAAGDPRHRTEVDWRQAINGLAQPQMAPGVWPLLGDAGAAGAPLYPVSRAAAAVAQALIALDTGLWPELAGAAAVGSRLQQETARGGNAFLSRLAGLVARHPLGRHAHDLPRRIAALARCPAALAAAADLGRTPGSMAFVVSGASHPQSAALVEDLRASSASAAAADPLRRCLRAAASGLSSPPALVAGTRAEEVR